MPINLSINMRVSSSRIIKERSNTVGKAESIVGYFFRLVVTASRQRLLIAVTGPEPGHYEAKKE